MFYVGAIIPIAPPRNYVPDPTIESFPPCSITLHIYMGKENVGSIAFSVPF